MAKYYLRKTTPQSRKQATMPDDDRRRTPLGMISDELLAATPCGDGRFVMLSTAMVRGGAGRPTPNDPLQLSKTDAVRRAERHKLAQGADGLSEAHLKRIWTPERWFFIQDVAPSSWTHTRAWVGPALARLAAAPGSSRLAELFFRFFSVAEVHALRELAWIRKVKDRSGLQALLGGEDGIGGKTEPVIAVVHRALTCMQLLYAAALEAGHPHTRAADIAYQRVFGHDSTREGVWFRGMVGTAAENGRSKSRHAPAEAERLIQPTPRALDLWPWRGAGGDPVIVPDRALFGAVVATLFSRVAQFRHKARPKGVPRAIAESVLFRWKPQHLDEAANLLLVAAATVPPALEGGDESTDRLALALRLADVLVGTALDAGPVFGPADAQRELANLAWSKEPSMQRWIPSSEPPLDLRFAQAVGLSRTALGPFLDWLAGAAREVVGYVPEQPVSKERLMAAPEAMVDLGRPVPEDASDPAIEHLWWYPAARFVYEHSVLRPLNELVRQLGEPIAGLRPQVLRATALDDLEGGKNPGDAYIRLAHRVAAGERRLAHGPTAAQRLIRIGTMRDEDVASLAASRHWQAAQERVAELINTDDLPTERDLRTLAHQVAALRHHGRQLFAAAAEAFLGLCSQRGSQLAVSLPRPRRSGVEPDLLTAFDAWSARVKRV